MLPQVRSSGANPEIPELQAKQVEGHGPNTEGGAIWPHLLHLRSRQKLALNLRPRSISKLKQIPSYLVEPF